MEVKYRRNITFLETRKIMESYMKENTCDTEGEPHEQQ